MAQPVSKKQSSKRPYCKISTNCTYELVSLLAKEEWADYNDITQANKVLQIYYGCIHCQRRFFWCSSRSYQGCENQTNIKKFHNFLITSIQQQRSSLSLQCHFQNWYHPSQEELCICPIYPVNCTSKYGVLLHDITSINDHLNLKSSCGQSGNTVRAHD